MAPQDIPMEEEIQEYRVTRKKTICAVFGMIKEFS
jgi:hypothetical protein